MLNAAIFTCPQANGYVLHYNYQQTHFGFINIILLYSDNRYVSATHGAIFRVVRARIQTYLQCLYRCTVHFVESLD